MNKLQEAFIGLEEGYLQSRSIDILGVPIRKDLVPNFQVTLRDASSDSQILLTKEGDPELFSAILEIENKLVLLVRHTLIGNPEENVSTLINNTYTQIYDLVLGYFEITKLFNSTLNNAPVLKVERNLRKYFFNVVNTITPVETNNATIVIGGMESSNECYVCICGENCLKGLDHSFESTIISMILTGLEIRSDSKVKDVIQAKGYEFVGDSHIDPESLVSEITPAELLEVIGAKVMETISDVVIPDFILGPDTTTYKLIDLKDPIITNDDLSHEERTEFIVHSVIRPYYLEAYIQQRDKLIQKV